MPRSGETVARDNWTGQTVASMNQITVTKRGADRIRGGHLWIYRSDLIETGEVARGAIVVVRDQSARFQYGHLGSTVTTT